MPKSFDNFNAKLEAAKAALSPYMESQETVNTMAEAIASYTNNPGDADRLANRVIDFAGQYQHEHRGRFV